MNAVKTGGQVRWHACNVFGGLLFHACEGDAFGLGLNRANGFAVHKQRVIRGTRGKGELADSDAKRRAEVDRVLCLDGPARRR